MLSPTLDNPARLARRPARLARWLYRLALGLLLVLTLLAAWLATRTHIVDLGNEAQLNHSGLLQAWKAGAVLVMIRHAERCDSAPGPCLGAPNGITVAGRDAASRAGQGLQRLGLADADLLASPRLRTRQTAHYLLGQDPLTEGWLKTCDPSFPAEALARKRPGHNLVLVTHNGCIDYFQREQRVMGGERESGYASALFVSVDGNGKARILGRMNEPQWQQVLAATGR